MVTTTRRQETHEQAVLRLAQRCMHNSALLVAMGFVPTEPAPEPEALVSPVTRCGPCNGLGTHPGTVSTGRSWTYANVTCETCHGTGQDTLAA